MSQAQVHTWGELTFNRYKDVFIRFFGSLPPVTLPFRLPQKLISTSVNPNTPVTKIGWNFLYVFTARRYAIARHAVIVCPSVRPPGCLPQVGVLQRRLNLGSHKQRHTIAHARTLVFGCKNLGEIPTRSAPTGAEYRGGVGSNRRFLTNISQRDLCMCVYRFIQTGRIIIC